MKTSPQLASAFSSALLLGLLGTVPAGAQAQTPLPVAQVDALEGLFAREDHDLQAMVRGHYDALGRRDIDRVETGRTGRLRRLQDRRRRRGQGSGQQIGKGDRGVRIGDEQGPFGRAATRGRRR